MLCGFLLLNLWDNEKIRESHIYSLLPSDVKERRYTTFLNLSPTADPLSVLYLPRVLGVAGAQVVSGLIE